jgi:hypothetical protein
MASHPRQEEAGVRDIDDIREKLRSGQGSASSAGGGRFVMLAVLACAVAFGAVFFVPRILSPGPGGTDGTAVGVPPTPARTTASAPVWSGGKSPAEIGKAADEACLQRAQARYPHSVTMMVAFAPNLGHHSELLYCLLTEGTQRYCSASDRRAITTKVVAYFGVIEMANRALKQVLDLAAKGPALNSTFGQVSRKLGQGSQSRPDTDFLKELQTPVEADPNVVAAIEARLRDGLLTKSSRDRIASAAPPPLGERFARIEPPKSRCPDEPWWAFWR